MFKRPRSWVSGLETNVVPQYSMLGLITLVAAALRFWKLGDWSLWIDEYLSIEHASNAQFSVRTFLSHRKPFYLLLQWVFSLFGENEWAARLIPALVGIATIPILFWFVKRLSGSCVALLAALLLAISPWHLYWSQNARTYSAVLLFGAVSLFSFYRAIETDRLRHLVLSSVALGLACALHLTSAVLVPVFVLYWLALMVLPLKRPAGLRFRNLVPFVVLPLIAYALLEIVTVTYFGSIPIVYKHYLMFFAGAGSSGTAKGSPYLILTEVLYYLGTPVALLSALGGLILWKRKSRLGILLTLGAIVPLLAMMLLAFFSAAGNRYVFLALPFWLILAAVAIQGLLSGWPTENRIPLFLVLAAGLLVLLARDPVIEDAVHYGRLSTSFGFLTLSLLAIAFWVALIFPDWSQIRQRLVFAGFLFVCVVAVVHPVVADTMYFWFQHGHRDNLRAVATAIREVRSEKDSIVALWSSPLDYYVGHEVLSFRKLNPEQLSRPGMRSWIVESAGVHAASGRWIEQNCRLTHTFDLFTAGRNWRMRLYLLEDKKTNHDKAASSTQLAGHGSSR